MPCPGSGSIRSRLVATTTSSSLSTIDVSCRRLHAWRVPRRKRPQEGRDPRVHLRSGEAKDATKADVVRRGRRRTAQINGVQAGAALVAPGGAPEHGIPIRAAPVVEPDTVTGRQRAAWSPDGLLEVVDAGAIPFALGVAPDRVVTPG